MSNKATLSMTVSAAADGTYTADLESRDDKGRATLCVRSTGKGSALQTAQRLLAGIAHPAFKLEPFSGHASQERPDHDIAAERALPAEEPAKSAARLRDAKGPTIADLLGDWLHRPADEFNGAVFGQLGAPARPVFTYVRPGHPPMTVLSNGCMEGFPEGGHLANYWLPMLYVERALRVIEKEDAADELREARRKGAGA